MPVSAPITVALARFEDLLAVGLREVIAGDASLEIVAQDVEQARIGVVLRAHRPRVAILDVDALPALAEVAQLGRDHPATRLCCSPLTPLRPSALNCSRSVRAPA